MAELNHPISSPCRAFEEDLVLLHYGDLGGAERDTLQAHVPSCPGCSTYLRELAHLLPLTVKADEPTESFWLDYNRELRSKIDHAAKGSWAAKIADFLRVRWMPVFATAVVVALALTFTLGKGLWPSNNNSTEDEALLEALPVAENLEFFKSMDVLDNLDLLEYLSSQNNGNV
jgi:hypothetical protein